MPISADSHVREFLPKKSGFEKYEKITNLYEINYEKKIYAPEVRKLEVRFVVDYAYNEASLQRTLVYNEPISRYRFEVHQMHRHVKYFITNLGYNEHFLSPLRGLL